MTSPRSDAASGARQVLSTLSSALSKGKAWLTHDLAGTAKGGISLAIARELALPVRYLAAGEAEEDLAPFRAAAFAGLLLGKDAT